jgi:hypothetical protein
VTSLRWLAFGDPDGAVWGAAWIPDGTTGHAVLGAGADTRVLEARLEAAAPDGEWRLGGDGLELVLSPVAADGVVRASGRLTLGAGEHQVDSPGWRATVDEPPSPGQLDSIRLLAAWFADDESLALLALRPRKARGQEGDTVTAALVESGAARTVSDPRLSTTYTGDGVPSRAGVELWVSEPAEEPGTVKEHPHRVAGEAAGPRASWTDGGLELEAQPFRWHSHGRDGGGVYLLGRS